MTDALNPKIIKKLDDFDGNIYVKKFIKEMLFYELGQIEEGSGTHYTNDYTKAIEKHLANYESERDENED